jgi:hypothetical protein
VTPSMVWNRRSSFGVSIRGSLRELLLDHRILFGVITVLNRTHFGGRVARHERIETWRRCLWFGTADRRSGSRYGVSIRGSLRELLLDHRIHCGVDTKDRYCSGAPGS